MATTVLVAYASTYGSTQEVAEAIAAPLREIGLTTDVRPARDVDTLAGYDAVVLGAPLILFRWHKDALYFLSRHRDVLKERPPAIFALGPTHDPYDAQEWQGSQAQLEKALAKFPWLSPITLKLFGGSYDPGKLRFPLNKLAGSEPASDIRDWTAIRDWAIGLADKPEPPTPVPPNVVPVPNLLLPPGPYSATSAYPAPAPAQPTPVQMPTKAEALPRLYP